MQDFLTLIAAFAGSVIACSYLPAYSPMSVLIGIGIHVTTGYYIATLIVAYSGIEHAAQPGLAFVMSLTARNILGGVMKMSERFRRKPPEPPSWKPS